MPFVPVECETFAVEGDRLMRRVRPQRGRPYEHACPRDVFERIAHAAEELGEQGFTLQSLIEHERRTGGYVSWTSAAVALAFLRERGILEVHGRRHFAATPAVHLDAMTEFWALAEEG